jgi:hypothetical protein
MTTLGFLIEEQGMTYLAEADTDSALTPLQTASYTYRIALGPRAGQTEKIAGPGLAIAHCHIAQT